MLKRRLCEIRFHWTLTCAGPLLVADGRYVKPDDPHGKKGLYPGRIFQSHARKVKELKEAVIAHEDGDLQLEFFVPGTSLRGPLRATAERILRTLATSDAAISKLACDPFEQDRADTLSCSKRLDTTKHDPPYAAACLACKLFGCTGTASRVAIADAEVEGIPPAARPLSALRDMVGIDRFTGGAYPQAKMRFHVLERSRLETVVAVTNFELWQLGLLSFAFQDFADGLVAIGSGKSKGFGQVRGTISKIEVSYPPGRANGHLEHLGTLATQAECAHYGLDTKPAPAADLTATGGAGLDQIFALPGDGPWRDGARQALLDRVNLAAPEAE